MKKNSLEEAMLGFLLTIQTITNDYERKEQMAWRTRWSKTFNSNIRIYLN